MHPTDCKHYCGTVRNGGKCSKGIHLRTHVGGADFGWITRLPCQPSLRKKHELPLIVPCEHYEPPAKEEYEQEQRELQAMIDRMDKLHPVLDQIKRRNKRGTNGTEGCPLCGGTLHWMIAAYNGHIRASCQTKDCVSLME